MTCKEGNCGPGCFNFGVDNSGPYCTRSGVRHLSGKSGMTSFRAQQSYDGSPIMDQLQRQFDDIFKIVNKYRQVRIAARKAEVASLRSRLKLMIARVQRLILQDQMRVAIAERRRELTLRVPVGFMSDLGYTFSLGCLEQLDKATTTGEFDSNEDLMASLKPYRNSLLANPARMAALRRAAAE